MARLAVSVVVGSDEHLIFRCLSTLYASAGDTELSVLVTCNGTNPALVAKINGQFPLALVSSNAIPLGFAVNHNRALRRTPASCFLIANDDVEFYRDCVPQCVSFFDRAENADVGSLTPRLLNPDGSLQRSTYAFPSVGRALLDLAGVRSWIPHNRVTDGVVRFLGKGNGRSRFWAHDRTCDVDTFRGAAIFVRAEAWRAVGELSEATRCGGEIAEWHRRCAELGWRRVFFAGAEAMHWGSVTVGRDPLLQTEYLKGYLEYFARHQPGALFPFRTVARLVAALRLAAAHTMGNGVGVRLWRSNLSVLRHQWKASPSTAPEP